MDIIARVATAFNVSPSRLLARDRAHNVVLARQVAMYILWRQNGNTLASIGRLLDNRTSATISHGFQAIANRILKDPALKRKIEALKEELNG